ncbi:type IV pilin [Halopenitus persicus]|uniref:type IV pilin n=1 Tax=Halopenitus persicus TaxID=1048396 RepID=UPI000BBB677E|nr:type IV pilin N-terminal domain-containing protein [Halopenitus persicus]
MNVKRFLDDDSAVSPVIGVILMVAITVILAAVIGTFVLGMGDDLQNTQPTASFNFDFEAGNTGSVTISHAGGDTIDGTSDSVTITTSGGSSDLDGEPVSWNQEISAGTSKSVSLTSGNDWNGETVTVNWQSADGSSSATLGSQTAPTP